RRHHVDRGACLHAVGLLRCMGASSTFLVSPVAGTFAMTSEVSAHRAVVLTPPGAAAIAVIRVCGESVVSFFRAHFSKPLTPLRCIHGELRDDAGQMIDDPVIVLHDDQRTADINLHGGPWVIAATLDLLRRNGFEVVENDPELLDADSVLEREMLAALQLARTEPALR